MDCVRPALGRSCLNQHFPALVFAGIRTVAVVPALEEGKVLCRWRPARNGFLFCDYCSMAGAELPDIWQIHLHPLKLWCGTATWQRPRRGWHVDGLSASHAECAGNAPLSRVGR